MVRAVLLVAVLLAGGACADKKVPDPHDPVTLSVAQAVAQIHQLNGKTVRVTGFLGMCEGYECHLFVDRDSAGGLSKARATTFSTTPPPEPRGPMLNIGSGPKRDFDAKAAPFVDSMVVITGTITDQCRDASGRSACTDRSPDIEPTDIASLKDK